MSILIAQQKRPDALNTTQNTPALCNVPFPNVSRKTSKKLHFWRKKCLFGSFSWFFQEQYIVESWDLLRCIQCIRTFLLSYQNWHSDHLKKIYIFIRGSLVILVGSKFTGIALQGPKFRTKTLMRPCKHLHQPKSHSVKLIFGTQSKVIHTAFRICKKKKMGFVMIVFPSNSF